jgi:heme exporter protein A
VTTPFLAPDPLDVSSSAPSPAPLLEAERLHLWRGQRHVLKGLSFAVAAGELIHVRGPNGCGKTSLLRTLAGFYWPEDGVVRHRGRPIGEDRDGFARDCAYLGHDNALKNDLTALENIEFSTSLRVEVTPRRCREVLGQLGVGAQADLPVRALSAGQKRRVAFARVLLGDARLWLLDEPFTNLDVAATRELLALVREHVAAGGAALLTAHTELALAPGEVRELVLA